MTTKAFTSALGYGITVRGYIDEDDRLVLLEPEGGGGNFTPVSVTIRPADEQQTRPSFTVEYIAVENGVAYSDNGFFTETTLELEALAKSEFLFSSASGYEIVAVSGAEAVEGEVSEFIITDEAVFTYKSVGDSEES